MNGKKQRAAFRELLGRAAQTARNIQLLKELGVLTQKEVRNLNECIHLDLLDAYASLPDRK